MDEIRVRSASKRFGNVVALRDANFTVRSGEVFGLIGPNGAGKSTLLECVAGLQALDSGEVMLNDAVLSTQNRRDGMLFLPDGIAPFGEHSVRWLLSWSAASFGATDAQLIVEIQHVLHTSELANRPVGALSKGQRKRVLLAMTLCSDRQFVLLDEPFDGLDVRQTRDAIQLLRNVANSGRGIAVSIHSMTDAERVCDRVAMLHNGSVIAEGTPAELKTHAGIADGALEDVFLALT